MVTVVTGATGTQGGAVARALLAGGHAVRALVRDRRGQAACALEAAGATLVQGCFEDGASLRAAMAGADALFSVQQAPTADPDSERRQARMLMEAARGAGVDLVVHSSVSHAGGIEMMEGWDEGRWARNYWESKRDAEAIVRDSGCPRHVILRPAFMMENFAMPKAGWMFPDLAAGELVTALDPETKMVLVAAGDIGAVARAAIERPDLFQGRALELAGDLLTLPEIAAILSRVKGRRVLARTMAAEQVVRRGQHAGWVETQQWMNSVNYPARPQEMAACGVTPTSFENWAESHADAIPGGSHSVGVSG